MYNTAPPGLKERILTSAKKDEGFSEPTNEEASPVMAKFQFGWKKKLEQMNEEEDMEAGISNPTLATVEDLPKQPLFGSALLLQSSDGDSSNHSFTVNNSPLHSSSISDDIFGGPPSSVEPHSSPLRNSPKSSPVVPSTRQRGHSLKSRIITDSDSEDQELPNSSSTAAYSSGGRRPQSRSSSTQPTSEDDMPPKATIAKTRKINSREVNSSRFSVTPLDFTEIPSKTSKKSKKIKKSKVKVRYC